MLHLVASDDESTQPAFVPSLRNAPTSGAEVPAGREKAAGAAHATDRHPAVGIERDHPASLVADDSDTDDTRVRHLDRAGVRAAFAEAEAAELTRASPPSSRRPRMPTDLERSSRDARAHDETTRQQWIANSVSDPEPAQKRTTRPPPARLPSVPPPRAVAPAYAEGADEDERQLQSEGLFGALVDLYRLRFTQAATSSAKAALLHKLASVHEYRFGEPFAAFDVLLEAFDLHPGDLDVVASLERTARSTGRVSDLIQHARDRIGAADHERRVLLLGHLVYWYERMSGLVHDAAPLIQELEGLDALHPLLLRRGARVAAARGDVSTQREMLLRALERPARPDETSRLHLELASAHAGTPEAARHYELALASNANCVIALQGLERIGREQANHGQIQWCLERLIEVAPTAGERIDALLKLAELQETEYLQRERAAELYERVVELEPSHPHALKALERCYHATRDWPRLATVMRARAEFTFDRSEKAERLELVADVLESKLLDPAGAIEVHRDVLSVDPKHRRALTALVRLYEKLGDWGNLSTYRARVAELAPSKRQAAAQLVQLADFLAAPERDPIAARLQYERAVTVDPTSIGAWEALGRDAARAGDDRRIVQCLQQRATLEEAPRARASIYVELAFFHTEIGAEQEARNAFRNALAADPSNEAAAVAMLDAYALDQRWDEAAPLCELLVRAAARDNDSVALFERLRLGTRIGAALGQADRAMTSSLSALDLRPDDEDARADLIAVCLQCRDNPDVIQRASGRLLHIANSGVLLPAELVMVVAEFCRVSGNLDAASELLERSLEGEPRHDELMKGLAEIYLAQGDYPRCCALTTTMAELAATDDTRFRLLCDAGEIWARRAGELDKAAAVFEEARKIRPSDHWVLHTLMWIYGERKLWHPLADVLEDIAHIQESADRKAKGLFALAQVVLEEIGDVDRAIALFGQVLDVDNSRVDAFEQLVGALTRRKDWTSLEHAYRRMIARENEAQNPDTNRLFALSHQLGLVFRDRMEDAVRALETLKFAASLRPDMPEVRRLVTELLVVTDDVDNAVARTRELIDRSPHDAELYAELYELFLRQHEFDRAWCTVDVLAQMTNLEAEQRRFHDDYGPLRLGQLRGEVAPEMWGSLILHPDLDMRLSALFSHFVPALARLADSRSQPTPAHGLDPAHSRLYIPIVEAFSNAARIFHVSPPGLLLGASSGAAFVPALRPLGALRVCVPAVEAGAESLAYWAGRHLAEQRPELSARAFFSSAPDLAALVGAMGRSGPQEPPDAAVSEGLASSVAANLTEPEREAIQTLLTQAPLTYGLASVLRWSQAADLSSMRAGLLLAGTVRAARKAIATEPRSSGDLSPSEKMAELYKFATSDVYAALRAALGIAVRA